MRFTLLTGLAGLTFALGAPAFAQDTGTAVADPAAQAQPAPAPYDPATPPATYDQAPATTTAPDPASEDEPFSGLYVGGSFGGALQPGDGGSFVRFDRGLDGTFGDTVTTMAGANAFGGPVGGFCDGQALTVTSPTNPTTPGRCRNDKDGIEYYGRVGFDIQRGKIVLGAVGEFGKPEIRDSVTAFSTTPANYVISRSVQWEALARLRAGFVAGRSTLFYGTGGGGYVSLNRDFSSSNTLNAYDTLGKRRRFGYVAGGGVEQMVGDNFFIGLEYLFHQYKDRTRIRVTQGTAPATNPFVLNGAAGTDFRRSDPNFSWHSMRVTAGIRF